MTRQKPEARLICYASIIALSLSGCSQHSGKLKGQDNITDNSSISTTPDGKNFQAGKQGHWIRGKKDLAGSKAGTQYSNLWDRLFDLYDLPVTEHPEVDRELSWFLNHPDYLNRVQERAAPFLYSIVKQVEKHDIPGELALLPVIESAFQPHAVSPARAAGIWQFIPSTGRIYGLKKSRTYDGRRDVYASTKAAIKYLKKLHNDFNGDWLLAIAAYNCGEGAVGRAIQRNQARGLPTDFWSLDLPQETRSYVPRLLAVSRLFAGAEQYGVDLHDIPNTAKFKPVKVNTQLDLALAADAADMSLDQLYELNPGFRGQYADVPGSYHLFIPAEKKTSEFKQELEKLILENQSSPREYREFSDDPNAPAVEPRSSREPLGEEASFAAAAVESFSPKPRSVSATPEPRKPHEHVATPPKPMHVAIPRETVRATPAPQAQPQKSAERSHGRAPVATTETATAERGKRSTYTVQAGETLWAVARKHSVDVGQLAKWNQFPASTNVKAGQALVVWSKDAAKKTPFIVPGSRPLQSTKYTPR